jgi:hypothetical protein
MEHNKDFTLIIHGPLSIYTVFMLYQYKAQYPIVLSTPRPTKTTNPTVLPEIQTMMSSEENNISLIVYDNVWPENINNHQNRYAHFFSVHMALQAVKTPYAIKIRSDEFYSNIVPVLDAVKEMPTKIITTDIFFRKSTVPFHPSDHMVAGETKMLMDVFATAKYLCEDVDSPKFKDILEYTKNNNVFLANKASKDSSWLAAEQFLGIGTIFTQCSPNKLKNIDHVLLMKELFHIVPTNKMGMFRVMYNSAKDGPKEYFDTSYFDPETDVADIKEY